MIIPIVIFLIVLYFILHYFNTRSSFHKKMHKHFCNKISYHDFYKITNDRNPILYYELRQLYTQKKNKVTEKDYQTIINKYK